MLFIELFLSFFLLFSSQVDCSCFFGQDLQGFYVTQSTISRGTDINYLEVVILHDSIPVWGICHRRFGNNTILYDMAGDMVCMRCFHIVARSNHILEIHTEALERCYTNEGAALTKCPTPQSIEEGRTTEIMLYKTKSLVESRKLRPDYCSIQGTFRATYDHNDGTESTQECPDRSTVVSNCPKGNRLHISFQRCSFQSFQKSFECLGSWPGANGQRYLALRDPTVDIKSIQRGSNGPPAPKYRCALYKIEPESGKVFLSMSSDSTCFNNLHSAWEGFESMVLYPDPKPSIPHLINTTDCQFPLWAQGQWEQLRIDGGLMKFTDLLEYKSYTVYCLGPFQGGLVPVYTQTQCGEVGFSCLALEERSSNVMESQISSTSRIYYNDNLCGHPATLQWPQWKTQGRVDRYQESPCPVTGEYTGVIPDEPSLCAKLYSDCNNPEIMFYTVAACSNKSQVFEEREYRCLGQWSESGVTYTYTERRDILGYECFAGVVVSVDQIFIIEAGENCERGVRPRSKGMRLMKQAVCHNGPSTIRKYRPPKVVSTSWWSTTQSPTIDKNVIGSGTQPSSAAGTTAFSIVVILICNIVVILVVRS